MVSTFRDPMAGILSGPIDAPPEDRLAKVYPKVPATPGLAVTHRASGFTGLSLIHIYGVGHHQRVVARHTGRSRLPRPPF